MGRIKTQVVKRTTHKLMSEHGSEFTTDFDKNKLVVNTLVDVPSRKLRNIIAGYATRLVKMGKKKE